MTEANELPKENSSLQSRGKTLESNNYDLFDPSIWSLSVPTSSARGEADEFPIGVSNDTEPAARLHGQVLMDPSYGLSRVDKPLSSEEHEKLLMRVNNDAGRASSATA